MEFSLGSDFLEKKVSMKFVFFIFSFPPASEEVASLPLLRVTSYASLCCCDNSFQSVVHESAMYQKHVNYFKLTFWNPLSVWLSSSGLEPQTCFLEDLTHWLHFWEPRSSMTFSNRTFAGQMLLIVMSLNELLYGYFWNSLNYNLCHEDNLTFSTVCFIVLFLAWLAIYVGLFQKTCKV